MGISAVYGTGIYNQSVYGWIYLKAQTNLTFSNQSLLKGRGQLVGNSSLSFSTEGKITQGLVSSSSIIFSDQSLIRSSHTASTQITFSQESAISAAKSQIEGSTTLVFDQKTFLEGHAPKRGQSKITFLTEGDLFATGEMNGDTLLKFSIKDSWINVNRIKAFSSLSFNSSSEVNFTNKNPYYPTWNGKYNELNQQTNPSVGYFGLLYTETSGVTMPPYIETVE